MKIVKKFILLLPVLFLFTVSGYALSVINGKWNHIGGDVTLFQVENGVLKEVATSILTSEREFSFALNHTRSGFYVIGITPNGATNNHVFYLKPDDNLNVNIGKGTYELFGNNTPENKEIQRWHELVQPLEFKSIYFMDAQSTYVDFFPLFEEKLKQIETYQSNVADPIFDKAFDAYRQFNLLHIALCFLQTPRTKHPEVKDYPDYYRKINPAQLTTTSVILDYPYGITLLRMLSMQITLQNAASLTEEERKEYLDPYRTLDRYLLSLKDEKVRGEVVLLQAGSIRSYEKLTDYQEKYGKYFVTESQKERFNALLIDRVSQAGGVAFDFKFKDVYAKEVALSDFKGKVVYVDVWATWCGPCKKEIPNMKELEEKYTGKDVVFLGVSIDDPKDYDKWKVFLVEEQLSGIQIFAGADRVNITKPYKINAIPRFMLFGKDGKIISTDAPRPGTAEIRDLIDDALKK
ncbi:Thiol:disulfide interchange protein TlpA [termite gut metagenome]|uniref:Thiol:disulfide interchange protein TlpA n=1 Tax=termite gut metagenome TaxID=433724 RepID=A0A5J4RV72_9ZZZZ